MEKASRLLTGLMLGLFALILAGAVLLGTVGSLEHKAYLAALLAGGLLAFLWWQLDRKLSCRRFAFETWGAAKTGLFLALLCGAVNTAWTLWVRIPPMGDYETFWNTACFLADGVHPQNALYLSLFPHIVGYAGFLSLFLRLFGQSVAVAVALNVALTTLSGLWIYLLLLRWRDLRTAAFGMLLWTVCPSKMLYNVFVLSEPYYTCLLLLTLLLISALERREQAGKARLWQFPALGALVGLLLRLVQTARPIAAVPIIALAIWLLLLRGSYGRRGASPWGWALFFALLLAVYLPLGKVWDAQLTRILEQEPARIPGYSIYVGFNQETGGAYLDADMDLLLESRRELGNAPAAQQRLLQAAKERIGSGKIRFPRFFAGKLGIFLGNDEGGAYYSRHDDPSFPYAPWAILSNVYYYALALLALGGAWRLWKSREQRLLLTVPLYGIGLTLAQMLVEVAARYHYSLIPMLVILAALACGEAKGEKL